MNKSKIFIVGIVILVIIILIILSALNNKKMPEKEIRPSYSKTKQDLVKEKMEALENKVNYINDIQTISPEIYKAEKVLTINPNEAIDSKKIFGPSDDRFKDELVYENIGIRTKDSYGRLNYIIFPKMYKNEIINGIKVTDSKEEVLKKINKQNVDIENDAIALETKTYYLYFDFLNKSVVYMPKLNSNMNKFIDLTKSYLESNDLKTYITSMTKEYPRYTNYNYGSREVNLVYPTLGIKIYINSNALKEVKQGILIYSNAKDLDKIKAEFENKNTNKPNNAALKVKFLDFSIIPEILRQIAANENVTRDLRINYKINSNFVVSGEKSSGSSNWSNLVVIFSPELNRLPYTLNSSGAADGVTYSSNKIYYNIIGEGIYEMNPFTKFKKLIYPSTKEFEIVDIENNDLIMKNGDKFNLIYYNFRKKDN